MVSLGCDKNLVDTEMMLGILSDKGFVFTDDETEAKVIVVNTCCFIGDAKEESINRLIEYGLLKENGNLDFLIATGCLAQRYHEEIKKDLPEVDAIIGTMSFDSIAEVINRLYDDSADFNSSINHGDENFGDDSTTPALKPAEEEAANISGSFDPFVCIEDINRALYGRRRILTGGGHYAYLKIAEGCDKNCTYCCIPKVRGRYRSFPMETLVSEARELAAGGVRELILVAQETTLYGVDIYGKKSLPELIRQLEKISGIYWIRLLYCYPEEITGEIAELFSEGGKLIPYIDMPIQHASDDILRRMGRHTTGSELSEKIRMLREAVPDICIRTTLITGFPSETEDDVNILADFIEAERFDRLGVFTYSAEEGTPAAGFDGQIDEDEKERRRGYLMELQQGIAFEKAEKQKGRILEVMIEGKVSDENVYVARSYMDAPGIDGLVFVDTDIELMTGDFIKVKITGSYEYDLLAEPV